MKNSTTKVVITGMGAMTPLGESVDEYWDNLVNGRSGVGPMTLCDPSDFPSRMSGEVSGFDPGAYIDKKEHRRMARFSQLAVAAAGVAIEDAGTRPVRPGPGPRRCGHGQRKRRIPDY